LYCRSNDIGEGDDNGSGGNDRDDIYKDNQEKPVLASLSDLYSKLEIILVGASRFSSCPISHYLLTTFSYWLLS